MKRFLRKLWLWMVRAAILTLSIVAMVIITPRAWEHGQLMTGWALPERSGPPLAIVAHRGHLDRFPENTLEAIVAAADAGADGIEFDIHQSADGTWWVIHDPTVDRTTNGTGAVHRLIDAELRQLIVNGGFGYDRARHEDIRLSTLSDVLSALSGYQGTLYVDIQHAVNADPGELAAMVAHRPAYILCRSLADARAIKEASSDMGTLMRLEAGDPLANVDGWLAEAVREATPAAVRRSALPVHTFLDEHRHGDDEWPALRRAWAIGVEAFLTKDLELSLAQRDGLASTSGR